MMTAPSRAPLLGAVAALVIVAALASAGHANCAYAFAHTSHTSSQCDDSVIAQVLDSVLESCSAFAGLADPSTASCDEFTGTFIAQNATCLGTLQALDSFGISDDCWSQTFTEIATGSDSSSLESQQILFVAGCFNDADDDGDGDEAADDTLDCTEAYGDRSIDEILENLYLECFHNNEDAAPWHMGYDDEGIRVFRESDYPTCDSLLYMAPGECGMIIQDWQTAYFDGNCYGPYVARLSQGESLGSASMQLLNVQAVGYIGGQCLTDVTTGTGGRDDDDGSSSSSDSSSGYSNDECSQAELERVIEVLNSVVSACTGYEGTTCDEFVTYLDTTDASNGQACAQALNVWIYHNSGYYESDTLESSFSSVCYGAWSSANYGAGGYDLISRLSQQIECVTGGNDDDDEDVPSEQCPEYFDEIQSVTERVLDACDDAAIYNVTSCGEVTLPALCSIVLRTGYTSGIPGECIPVYVEHLYEDANNSLQASRIAFLDECLNEPDFLGDVVCDDAAYDAISYALDGVVDSCSGFNNACGAEPCEGTDGEGTCFAFHRYLASTALTCGRVINSVDDSVTTECISPYIAQIQGEEGSDSQGRAAFLSFIQTCFSEQNDGDHDGHGGDGTNTCDNSHTESVLQLFFEHCYEYAHPSGECVLNDPSVSEECRDAVSGIRDGGQASFSTQIADHCFGEYFNYLNGLGQYSRAQTLQASLGQCQVTIVCDHEHTESILQTYYENCDSHPDLFKRYIFLTCSGKFEF